MEARLSSEKMPTEVSSSRFVWREDEITIIRDGKVLSNNGARAACAHQEKEDDSAKSANNDGDDTSTEG